MSTKGRTEQELWSALEGLDDDLLDPDVPSALVDEALRSMGLDPSIVTQRGIHFVNEVTGDGRLAWQARAREQRAQLEAKASRATAVAGLDRAAVLARLEQLRAADPGVGSAIQMAARKRKPEESTDDELRALLEQMEALRAIEDDASE
jgi:hypothetical protein